MQLLCFDIMEYIINKFVLNKQAPRTQPLMLMRSLPEKIRCFFFDEKKTILECVKQLETCISCNFFFCPSLNKKKQDKT